MDGGREAKGGEGRDAIRLTGGQDDQAENTVNNKHQTLIPMGGGGGRCNEKRRGRERRRFPI